MPIFLNENEVGFDTQLVGFPNLGACMGVVVLTDQGMFGFHPMPRVREKYPVFAQYIQQKAPTATLLRFYGSCSWKLRYNLGAYGWKDEMRDIANAIGFHGKVKGLDTSQASHGEKRDDHCNYVEYRPVGGGQKCEIYYKKMDKMQLGAPLAHSPAINVQWTGGNRLRDPQNNQYIPSANVNVTPGNKGQLHRANVFGMHTFSIP